MDNNSFQGNNGFVNGGQPINNNMNRGGGRNIPNANMGGQGNPFGNRTPNVNMNQGGNPNPNANRNPNFGQMPGGNPNNMGNATGPLPNRADINKMMQTGKIPTDVIAARVAQEQGANPKHMNPNIPNPAMQPRGGNRPMKQGGPAPMQRGKMPKQMPNQMPHQGNMEANNVSTPPQNRMPMQQGQVATHGGRPVLRKPNSNERPPEPLHLTRARANKPDNRVDRIDIMRMDAGGMASYKKKKSMPIFTTLIVLFVICVCGFITKDMWYPKAKSITSKMLGSNKLGGENNPINGNNVGGTNNEKGPFYVNIYYKSQFSDAEQTFIHYKAGMKEWTSDHGVEMQATTEMEGFNYKYTIELENKSDTTLVCFNNGDKKWDSNDGSNYLLVEGTYGISDKTCYIIKSDIEYTAGTVSIYYYGFTDPYIHYQKTEKEWTTPPGVAMEAVPPSMPLAKTFTNFIKLPLGDLPSIALCFNDGNNRWDNNNNLNYVYKEGTYFYEQGTGSTRFLDISQYDPNASNATEASNVNDATGNE